MWIYDDVSVVWRSSVLELACASLNVKLCHKVQTCSKLQELVSVSRLVGQAAMNIEVLYVVASHAGSV